MSPARPKGPAFRACGGEVVSRAGQPVEVWAPLLRLLDDEAEGESAVAICCAGMAHDLRQALLEAYAWRRAAAHHP